jgi:hypothetical protein
MNQSFFGNPDQEGEYNSFKHDEFNQSHFSTVYCQYFEGGLFHSTTVEGLRGIIRSRHIAPNKDQFPFTFPQSENSFAYENGYISLFDFRNSQEEEIIHHYWKFNTFFCRSGDTKIILRINHQNLELNIIPNNANPQIGHPDHRYSIPIYEVWYPDEIPISEITQVIISRVDDENLDLKEFPTIGEAETSLKN